MLSFDAIHAYYEQYNSALLEDVIPFWNRYSLDPEHGGYFTCLDRKGNVYDQDKFIWLQARQVWMYAFLYNRLDKNERWLEVAEHGARFLLQHGRDEYGNWYFSLTRDGKPLVQPYNIFSDCFAAMAFSQYSLAAQCESSREIASKTFDRILHRMENPKGVYNKAYPGTRPMRSLAIPMILSNLCMELNYSVSSSLREETIDRCVHDIADVFLDKNRMLLYEHRAPDGSPTEGFEGRISIPGHGIEATWFLMDIAESRGDSQLIELCVETMLSILRFGWDEQHGGIFYFLDLEGKPPQQLEWDQKLWWVHLETLVALLKGFRLTGKTECWEWFVKVHEYSWNHFGDPEYGEWFGYCNRRGEILLPLKGGKWKGCFHVPRAMYLCAFELNLLCNQWKTDETGPHAKES